MKRILKWVLVLAVMLLLVLCCASAMAANSGTCGNNLTWTLDDNGTLTISGTGEMSDYSYGHSPWYAQRDQINTVVIGNGVSSLGEYAFLKCSALMNINFPSSLTSIHHCAFEACGFISIVVPDTVKTIGDWVFARNASLISITLPSGLTNIGGFLFYDCTSLTSITIPSLVTSIGTNAFENCSSLTSIVIPQSVKSIGNNAFAGCGRIQTMNYYGKEISLGGMKSHENKGDICSFRGNNNTMILYGNGAVGNYSSNYSAWGSYPITSLYVFEGITGIGDYAFQNCMQLTSVTIPESLIRIGKSAFSGCSSIEEIHISNLESWLSLTADLYGPPNRNRACRLYMNDVELTSITIPDTVTNIRYSAFYNFINLTSITIPESVSSISKSAFCGCSGIVSITIPDGVVSLDETSFYDCSSLMSITIPESVTSIGADAFYGCSSLSTVYYKGSSSSWNSINTVNPGTGNSYLINARRIYQGTCGTNLTWELDQDGLLVISGTGAMTNYTSGNNPLDWRSSVETVRIQSGVTRISSYAFQNCSKLKSITIPSSITSIGGYAFQNCSSLKSVSIPSNVKSISNYTFYGCSSLTSIAIPTQVTSIDYYAFYNCSGLTSVTVPASVTSISSYAFSGCNNINRVNIQSLESWLAINYGNNSSHPNYGHSCHLYLNGSELKNITIPSSVTSIGSYAFYNCSGLTSITIPSHVTSIGTYAFYGCGGITSVTIQDGMTSIGSAAFSSCSNLQTIILSGQAVTVGGGIKGNGTSGNVKYMIGNNNTLILYGNGATANYTSSSYAPWKSSGITYVCILDGITGIGNYAFYGCSSLTSLTIPASVSSIGSYAFSGCNSIDRVNISSLESWLTINYGNNSSHPNYGHSCSLYSNDTVLINITIPDNMTSIGSYAFYNCNALTGITIPAGIASVGINAFTGCNAIKYTDFDTDAARALSKAGYSFRVQGKVYDLQYLYTDNEITGLRLLNVDKTIESISITEEITSIGDSAFENCSSLTSITIPTSVTSIGSNAFYGCSAIRYADFNTETARALSKAGYSFRTTGKLYDLQFEYIGNTISGLRLSNVDKTIESIVIAEEITSIDNDAFADCSSLTGITIPDGVLSIGSHAFNNCSSLTWITIPDSVTSIGRYAFNNCTSLSEVSYLGSVDSWLEISIGNNNDILRYTSITFAESPEIASAGIDGNTTWILNKSGELTITGTGDMPNYFYKTIDGKNVTTAPWGANAVSVVIGNGITSIGAYAFRGCSNLTSITIPNGLTSIAQHAFYDCSSMTSIVIPEGVTSIGNSAFAGCSIMTSIAIPASVISIDRYAFSGCRSLSEIKIPEGVTSVGNNTFYGCRSLTSMFIPAGVTSIGDNAFSSCNGLTNILIPASVASIGNNAFKNCSGLETVYYAGSVSGWSTVTIGTENSCLTSAKIIYQGICGTNLNWMLDDGTLTISGSGEMADYSYKYVSSSYNTTAPWSTSVTSVIIDDGVTSIGDYAFSGNSGLTSISIPDSITSIGNYPFRSCNNIATVTVNTCDSYARQWAKQQAFKDKVIILTHQDVVDDEEVAPTCTMTGLTAGSHCTVCGDWIVPQETIPALAHTPEIDPAIPATDTQPGLTEGSHCSVCGQILTAQQTVSPRWGIEKTATQVTITQYNGSKVNELSIPDMLEELPVRAIAAGAIPYAKCPTRVYIPSSVTSIASNAFGKSVTIYCHEYSEADYWADDVGYSKVYVDDTAAGTFYIITMPSDFTMELGDTRELGAAYWPVIGSNISTITNSNPDVIELNGQELTAKAVGQSTITMKVGGKTASVTITVHADASDFKLYLLNQAPYSDRYADELYIITKATNELSVVDIEPEGAELSVTYASTDTSIATVDANGLVTAKRPGTCSITATSQTGLVRTCEVTVCYPVTSVAFDQASYRVPFGEPIDISVSAVTNGGTYVNRLVYLESEDESIATTDDVLFKINPMGIGTTTITATADSGVSATATVEVYCPDHRSVIMPEVPATCTKDGRTGGRYCPTCGEIFTSPTIIPATGHRWGEATYTWTGVYSITAKHVCQNDEDHVETETVPVEMHLVSPTETTAGSYTYVSNVFANPAFSVQRKSGSIPALNTLNVLRIPTGTKSIGEEAFANSAFQAIIIPDNCISVASRAFAGCSNLVYVKIPIDCDIAEDAFDGRQDVIIDFDGYVPPTPTPAPTPEPTPTPKPKQTLSMYGCATVQVPETMYLSDNIYYDSESSLAVRYGKLNYTSYSSLKSALQSAYGTVEEFTLNGINMLGIAEITSSYSISGVAFMANGQAIMITFMFTDDEGGELSAECINSIRLLN